MIDELFLNTLQNNGLVVMPTETVYGLAGNAKSDVAVAEIYALKNRPTFNPLIIHIPSFDEAFKFIDVDPETMTFMRILWVDHLCSVTFVARLKDQHGLSPLVTAGLDTVGVRLPQHPLAQKLIQQFGNPLAAPSANPSQALSPTTPDHVRQGFLDKCPPILDGGPCKAGLESTIIDLTVKPHRLLRPGALTLEKIKDLTGIDVNSGVSHDSTLKAPGMMTKHYAPRCPVVLNWKDDAPEFCLKLAFGQKQTGYLNLSEVGDLVEAAVNFFNYFHILNSKNPRTIYVSPIPNNGLGRAINDRLIRAAAHA